MDVRITKLTGEQFLLSDYDIVARDFMVSSMQITPYYKTIEGRNGTVDMGASYGSRTITVPFFMKAKDMLDYPLLRDLLYGFITDLEPFYIEELRRVVYGEGESNLVGGKRYLVRLNNTIDPEQQFRYGFGELEFVTTDLPFAESIGTTQDIQRNGIDADSELWGFGMGLIADDESLIYTHETNEFRIYNAGNRPIHPFQQELKIKVTNAIGSLNYLQLRNKTNNTLFKINEAVRDSQVIVFDGPNVTSNGLQYLRATNKQFIELEPGWNNFELTGASRARTEFDFRFYYA